MVARDSIHDPLSLQFTFEVLKSKMNNIKTFYLITRISLIQPKNKMSYSSTETTYTIEPL